MPHPKLSLYKLGESFRKNVVVTLHHPRVTHDQEKVRNNLPEHGEELRNGIEGRLPFNCSGKN